MRRRRARQRARGGSAWPNTFAGRRLVWKRTSQKRPRKPCSAPPTAETSTRRRKSRAGPSPSTARAHNRELTAGEATKTGRAGPRLQPTAEIFTEKTTVISVKTTATMAATTPANTTARRRRTRTRPRPRRPAGRSAGRRTRLRRGPRRASTSSPRRANRPGRNTRCGLQTTYGAPYEMSACHHRRRRLRATTKTASCARRAESARARATSTKPCLSNSSNPVLCQSPTRAAAHRAATTPRPTMRRTASAQKRPTRRRTASAPRMPNSRTSSCVRSLA
mmetsp:Transcript_26127/g.93219  ORF Transcript_26127/g.93219 Transcript_26127/m.93219 type:complete len:278 (+) Transcript_26127:88-921(+)